MWYADQPYLSFLKDIFPIPFENHKCVLLWHTGAKVGEKVFQKHKLTSSILPAPMHMKFPSEFT